MSTMTLSSTTVRTVRADRPARAARTVPAARPASGVRLTRRGRLVVFVLSLLVVLSLGVAWGATSVAGESAGTPEPTEIVMVGSGETLWDIASDASDGGDV